MYIIVVDFVTILLCSKNDIICVCVCACVLGGGLLFGKSFMKSAPGKPSCCLMIAIYCNIFHPETMLK